MRWSPEEDFERAFRDRGAESFGQGLVVLAVGVPLLAFVEGARVVRDVAARWRRWPLPASLGCLTNEAIDALPEHPPAPVVRREDVERVIADAKARRN